MGLTFYYKFGAPAAIDATVLADFLLSVEDEAKRMGFAPTIVVDAPFDSDEQRNFARRITTGLAVENARLKNVHLQKTPFIIAHDPVAGVCRLSPEHGVLLVVTDEYGREGVFGFFRFSAAILDENGTQLVRTPIGDSWTFSDFVKTADPRYRSVVKRFADAGYLVKEQDDYLPAVSR